MKSFQYALRGLAKVFREEQNLRVQTLAGLVASGLAAYFSISLIEWCILLIAIMTVLLMEIANSAVERVTDVLKPRINNYVKEIKDIMAAAVMLASVFAVIIGAIIFLPHIFELI
ncbi:MAG: diacylglycerol kinase family protein [Candidatus Magasanikbacteria bacterium]|nr:diacylglycerol kinase family protein [Candidatus Magasanikbacteria bacterium]